MTVNTRYDFTYSRIESTIRVTRYETEVKHRNGHMMNFDFI